MRKKILIVDDQVNTLKVIGAILRDEGYEVFSGRSASEALRIFEDRGDIDAILSDMKMPGESGFDLYQKIRTIEKNTPFIIMTAHGTIESAVRAMKDGVTNYLIKPINYEELSVVLERAIREKEITRELGRATQRNKRTIFFSQHDRHQQENETDLRYAAYSSAH